MSEEIKVGRRTISVSSLDKVLFPDSGYTKRDLIEYYETIADVMIPHTRDRLMTLERFPNGIEQDRFFAKDAPKYYPDWIPRARVPKKGGTVNHVVCNERATLVYAAQQNAITVHVSMNKIDALMNPDMMMFDLDPTLDDFNAVRSIAKVVRDLLDELDLYSVVKTSGSRGLHVVVPLDGSADYSEVHDFAKDAANLLAARDDRVTTQRSKADRGDRLLMDWWRNNYAQTAVAAYTVRARPGAPVAMPIHWDEVGDKKLSPQGWNVKTAPKRIADEGDAWRGWRRRAKSLTKARRKLDALLADA